MKSIVLLLFILHSADAERPQYAEMDALATQHADDSADLPPACVQFGLKCQVDIKSGGEGWLSSWLDVQHGFEACCLGGGHSASVCQGLSEELVEGRSGEVQLSSSFCDTLMDLHAAHIDKAKEDTSSDPTSLQQRGENIYSRAKQLAQVSPGHVGALLAAATVGTGASVLLDIGSASAMVVSYLATLLSSCDHQTPDYEADYARCTRACELEKSSAHRQHKAHEAANCAVGKCVHREGRGHLQFCRNQYNADQPSFCRKYGCCPANRIRVPREAETNFRRCKTTCEEERDQQESHAKANCAVELCVKREGRNHLQFCREQYQVDRSFCQNYGCCEGNNGW